MERKSRVLKRKGQKRIDGGYEVVEREAEGQRALHNFQLLSHTHIHEHSLASLVLGIMVVQIKIKKGTIMQR